MKNLLPFLLLAALLGSCKHDQQPIVSDTFIDSLIQHYTPPAIAKENEGEMQFWSGRISPALPGFLSESRYAGGLATEFRFFGDIDSLKKSDSILKGVLRYYNYKEASADLALTNHSITEHRFSQADSLLQKAKLLGLRPYESSSATFDVDFELGNYTQAQIELNAIRSNSDYGYFFRKSKMDHLNGALDSSIRDMLRSAELASDNPYLKGVALANAADLYIHAGDLEKAASLYMECLRLNSADFHSLMGLGWIATVHDHHTALAAKIFRFVQSKNKLPDPLFKLAELAETGTDSAGQKKAAQAFEQLATEAQYGRMYNKYLIQLYTGILKNPAYAESLAKDELNNRSTPQTYAWYAWTLFSAHQPDSAYQIFDQHVSGKPLEGLELYYMGKLMKGLNKGYNAREFFKAAYTTRYDLSPAIEEDIQRQLEE